MCRQVGTWQVVLPLLRRRVLLPLPVELELAQLLLIGLKLVEEICHAQNRNVLCGAKWRNGWTKS